MPLATGALCQYHGCYASRRKVENLRMFRFPKDPELQRKWVINAGNAKLLKYDPEELHSRSLCHKHFNPAHIGHRFLKKGTIPIKWSDEPMMTVLPVTRTYSRKPKIQNPPKTQEAIERERDREFLNEIINFPEPVERTKLIKRNPSVVVHEKAPQKDGEILNEIINIPGPIQRMNPIKRNSIMALHEKVVQEDMEFQNEINNFPEPIERTKLIKKNPKKIVDGKILEYRRKLGAYRTKVFHLNKKVELLKTRCRPESFINSLTDNSHASKTLVKMQVLRKAKTTIKWDEDEKELALALHYESPSFYKFLTKTLQIILPSTSTIKKWRHELKAKKTVTNDDFLLEIDENIMELIEMPETA